MKIVLRLASYIFHPLWMPFFASVLYFAITPRYFPPEVIKTKLVGIAIMLLFIPIVFYFLLRTLGIVKSYFLAEVKERKWPLLFYLFLLSVILKFVLDIYDYPELFYYFLGILVSTFVALFLVFFRIKISLHMLGLGALLMFIISLSLHFAMNLTFTLGFFLAITGLTATSRLDYKAHSYSELIFGFFAGFFPQLLMWQFWL
ncbi:MAG TPA: hypothetical protein VFM59_04565 [Salinimicrobium sp.]|nr:hypothetical protein [Salinimicrobium sp.]